MKRIISLALVLAMLTGVFPINVFATEEALGTQITEATVTEVTEETAKAGTADTSEETEPIGEDTDLSESAESSQPEDNAAVVHEHEYAAVVTLPTYTEKGYTTYTCECGDTYRTQWLVEDAYKGKTIACIGDSITYGYGVTQGKTDYVTLMAEQLGMNYIRLGDSGTSLCAGGIRTCNIRRLTEDYLQGADICTIALGINDFCAAEAGYYELGDINSTDTSTIYGATRMWCEQIEELRKTDSLSHTQFYFMTPVIASWNNSVTSERNWDQSKTNIHGYTLRDLSNAIMEVAALYDVAVIDMNLLSGMYYVDSQDNNVAVFGGDGVHPGEKGHEMMANALANALLQNDLRNDHTHTFGSWITTTWPSCAGGEQQRVCTICYTTEARALESDGNHRYGAVVTAPTYSQQGYTTYTCSVCGDSYISDYTDATQPRSYRWEMQDNALVSVTENGNTANGLTLTSGSITDGTFKSVRYNLQNKVRLNHNLPWAIEWRSAGNWDGMLLASTNQSASVGLTYLFRFASMNFLALGEYTGTWDNYGLIHNIDMTASHVFRLENRIASDGSNAVYLLVDGQEIDTMDHYYVGGTNKNQRVNWANGKDIVFNNIGTSSHPVKDMKLDYLQIWEEVHVHTYESVVTAPTCTEKGYTTYTCTCGDSYVEDYKEATGDHRYQNGVCMACGAVDPDVLEPMSMQYDDHLDVTGKTVEIFDGVVTMDGNYLVATDVGTAIVRMDDTIYKITVEKAKLNLVMIMGQSNAGNHFQNAISDVTCPAGTAYWWGNGQGTSATEPVPYTQPSLGFHTPLLAELYAQSVADGAPVKNVLIWEEGITSKNGQSIVKWAASAQDTSGTDGAVEMLNDCRAYYEAHSNKYEIVSSGIYWLQGESDTGMDSERYTQLFMAMWQRMKKAGMEYVAFLRVRRASSVNAETRDDLYYSGSLSAQIKMINENPEFYMATTVTENWTGTVGTSHDVDISRYITMMETYGQKNSYSDSYGNKATYANGILTTTMKELYGSNNTCHYGKFGYGIIGADAAYNMYKAMHAPDTAIEVTVTSGHADLQYVLTDGQEVTLDASAMTDNLSFRAATGSAAGTLKFTIKSGASDITAEDGLIITSGEQYGAVNVQNLRDYEDVSIEITYSAADGKCYTAVCKVLTPPAAPKKDYIWDFEKDLYARSADGEIQNALVSQALKGSYTLENGCLTGVDLQMALENAIKLDADKNWSVEWKYGSLNGGLAGFLLCKLPGNTLGNKAIWHMNNGQIAIADYLDSEGYRNYTSSAVAIKDYDRVRISNQYDPEAGKSVISLWINEELVISDFQLKGSMNNYHDREDMTGHPLHADFTFGYLGSTGMADWDVNCQLDYLKISFGEVVHEHEYAAAVTDPTCTEKGYTTYTCACGDSYVDDYVDVRPLNILMIGNSFSWDAADFWYDMQTSMTYDAMKAMLDEQYDVHLAVMYKGSATLGYHATCAANNTGAYTFQEIGAETGYKWQPSAGTNATNKILERLQERDWDIIVIQSYQHEADGTPPRSTYTGGSDEFIDPSASLGFLLDYFAQNEPGAEVFYYMPWSSVKFYGADGTAAGYEAIGKYTQEQIIHMTGTTSEKKLAGIIPVGTAIENARTTYLHELSYTNGTGATALLKDPQIGLLYDTQHLSFGVGRYIAGITVARSVIPQAMRKTIIDWPSIKESPSVGALPEEYSMIARKAVENAMQMPYEITPISGYDTDLVKRVSNQISDTDFTGSGLTDEASMRSYLEATIQNLLDSYGDTEYRLTIHEYELKNGEILNLEAEISLRIGYTSHTEQISVMDGTNHRFGEWCCLKVPTADGPGLEQRVCAQCGYVDRKEVEGSWQKYDLKAHLQDLPENYCAEINLWNHLKPESVMINHLGDWVSAGATVYSVTIPVKPGDHIYANAFGVTDNKKGIQVSFIGDYGILKTTFSSGTYQEYLDNGGYLIAPEGTIAVNVPVWNNEGENTLKILNREHLYIAAVTDPTCTEKGYTTYTCACGDSYVDDHTDPRGYEWMLEDGEFKILLIGNSFSEDASNAGMPNSQTLDILQAMLGEDVSVTVGLCYSGGKGLNWHATQSEQGNSSYSLRVISTESGSWKNYSSYTSAKALTFTDWDVVSLQHYEINTTTGKESNAYSTQVDPKFDNLKSATEFMLDYVDRHAPQAATYFYMHWARAYNPNLNESLATYNKMAAFFPVVMDYSGPETNRRFESIIPVGLAVQNARTTYLATLAYNRTNSTVNLNTDVQIGLQRDTGHLSYNVGRYLAALTFAETIIPGALREEGYVLPEIRVTESVGKLPSEYSVIVQKSVRAAVDSWRKGSLAVTSINGYAADPAVSAKEKLENVSLMLTCAEQERMIQQIRESLLAELPADFAVDAVVLDRENAKAAVTIRYGYTSVEATVSWEAESHCYEYGFCVGCGEKIPSKPMSMRYDDHYDVTGKTVEILNAGTPTSYQVGYGVEANKVLDTAVVTLKGNALVATGIGTALVQIDGETYEITVTAAPISMLLIIGQSNAEGMEGNANQSVVCPDGQVYSTYAKSNGLTGDAGLTVENAGNYVPSALTGAYSTVNVNGTDTKLSGYPVNSLTEAGAGKYGMDSGLAYEWVKQTGEKVWVVNAAHGASSITSWQKGADNYDQAVALFGACQQVLQAEITAGHYTFSHMGYYWNQGCADEEKSAEWYVNQYLAMHTNLKNELACDMDLNPATADNMLEFGNIVLVQAGHSTATGYRKGVYEDATDDFFMTWKELELRGPRVAQIWMANNPELRDIHIVSTLAQDWVTMPNGTDGVADYFRAAYTNGTVDYRTQVKQSSAWYTPTTPAAVKDSIHYNQIGYNEIGRESARNSLYILGIVEKPDVDTKVTFLNWTGYQQAESLIGSAVGTSDTLVVPLVYPCYESKSVTYTLSDGLSWPYYDLLDSGYEGGTLTASVGTEAVHVTGRTYNSYRFELQNGKLISVSNDTFRENALTTASAGVYTLSDSILLKHDKPWIVEFNNTAAERFMALTSSKSTREGMCYIFKSNSGSGVLAIGEYKDGLYQNYGLLQTELTVDWKLPHVYRFQNVINADGTNTVHIYIDDVWVGTATNQIINSVLQNTDNQYLSGKDLVFTNIGCSSFGLNNNQMSYLEVWENGKPNQQMSLKYDDHYDVTGKNVEILDAGTPTSYQVGYGVEENKVLDTAVVTMKGNTLVATGIGTAMVRIDDQVYEITVEAAPISLMLLIGQSNMRGSEGNADQSIVCPDGMVYASFGDDRGDAEGIMIVKNATNFAASALTGEFSSINVNGTTDNLSYYPINSLTEAGNGTFGPDSGFAYEWVKQTGEKIWVVNAAHGGSAISSWQPNATNFKEAVLLFSACQETLRKEIAAGHFTLSHMGYFWCQGCNDASMTAETYVQKYLAMHEGLKSELDFDHDTNSATAEVGFEFAGIIPILYGVDSYRAGEYKDQNPYTYYQSFEQLTFNGPRVAQYWMCNNPDLEDIWMVCNIGEDWVWMPDGTNGVSTYFQNHYANGTVDYTTQVAQKTAWYTPTTPAAVHDSIHYNQIGYNEIGRESVRNALIMLGEIAKPEVETTVELLSWDGYTPVEKISASLTGNSGTLVVPKVYPVWKTKEVEFALSDGLTWNYYDLLSTNPKESGTLQCLTASGTVSVSKVEPYAHFSSHLADLPENICCGLNLWSVTEHDQQYFANGNQWGVHTSGNVPSITLMVDPGERIYASSFGAAETNGSSSTNGIRMTYFSEYGVLRSYTPAETYAEFCANNGYLVVPEGAVAMNIPMWNNSDNNEIYILNREHNIENGSCSICNQHIHQWSEWSHVTAPTADGLGVDQRTCACGASENREVEGVWQIYDLSAHLLELPENICGDTNLWPMLPHEDVHFTSGKKWGKVGVPVPSITIPVNPGDKIFATSFQKAVENGHETSNGIRVTFFDAYGVAKTLGPGQTDKEFYANGGYLIAPEGTIAVNIGMWYENDAYEVYILNRDHIYENGICAGCGDFIGPVITQQPESVEQEIGKEFAITVEAEGEGLTYQWYYKDAGMEEFEAFDNQTSSYADTMQNDMHNRQVFCVITDVYGNQVTSETVTIICTNYCPGHDFGDWNTDDNEFYRICALCGYVELGINGAAVKNADGSIRKFESLDEAIQAAVSGDTIVLLNNTEIYYLFVPVDVDFDLNGYVLTATYVASFGNIIDNSRSNTGYMKVSDENIMIQKSNRHLPVRDQGGYRFVEILKFNQRLYAESYKFAFQPLFEESAHQYLMQGSEVSGITIGVKVSWKNDQGPRSQTFTYKDSLVQQFIQSYKGSGSGEYGAKFTLVLTGAEGLDDLQYQIVVKSETGVQIAANPKLQPST